MNQENTDLASLLASVDNINNLLLDNRNLVLAIAAAILILLIILIAIKAKGQSAAKTDSLASEPAKEPLEASTQAKDKAIPSAAAPSDITEIKAVDQQGWLKKLKAGLSKTRDQITSNLSNLFTGKTVLDDELLEQIHEALYRADLGVETADLLIEHLKSEFKEADQESLSFEMVKNSLKGKINEILTASEVSLDTDKAKPYVILVVGVNGVGKTTSIGKLTAHFMAQNKKVLLGAADTFRAAAIDQLQVWADRLEVEVVKHQAGADPASVAFDTVKAAKARESDVVLIDTAGRLHSKKELMDELAKIRRVVGKEIPEAPHETWLVVDSTNGQNALQQIKAFTEVTPLSGLIVTKLDGTAKGGVVISASHKFKIPIHFIGVGEKAADLRAFKAKDFADSIF